ncbi:phosphoric diester hydrolase Ecym_4257 [Eremothecium cymbalariae DBVPG|uniref:U6 snRNA phosphodiesterase 1 n=1 Tax=Eremothecium cymbalariae (strain CBS 270.75 / DBVPG 7215 / KCTC 17166 / NRRL Y-17582) TaxID=931890 RepID=G8JTG8_ERECY|nr:hypothetical protein Ecym_4257 [Eremothecium cymbalariae DBVPG\
MNLIRSNYDTDSDVESEIEREHEQEHEQLPCIPDKVIYRYQKDPKMSTSLSQLSKKRNWSAFAFIEFQLTQQQLFVMNNLVREVNETMKTEKVYFSPLFYGRMNAVKPLHISLSPTLMFPDQQSISDWIQAFKSKITQDTTLRRFNVHLQPEWSLYPNFDKTVWFLSLPVVRNSGQEDILPKITGHLKTSSMEHGASFGHLSFEEVLEKLHLSVASDPNNPTSVKFLRNQDQIGLEHNLLKLQKRLQNANSLLQTSGIAQFQVKCTELKIKRDNSIISIPLPY